MAVAMVGIVWAMGLLIGLGFPVHIMSSMSPVFLMAIATDSVHIFNEFAFRFREVGDKREAVRQTMEAVGRPVLYSDLTTAAGFASLATGPIVPVKIFGLVVAFGTLVILLMSFTLVPAILALRGRRSADRREPEEAEPASSLARRASGQACVARQDRPSSWSGPCSWPSRPWGSRRSGSTTTWSTGSSRAATCGWPTASEPGASAARPRSTSWRRDRQPDAMKDRSSCGARRSAAADRAGARGGEDLLRGGLRQARQPGPQRRRPARGSHSRFAGGGRAVPVPVQHGGAARGTSTTWWTTPSRRPTSWCSSRAGTRGSCEALLEEAQASPGRASLPGAEVRPAGIAYFNMVWNDEVLVGMLEGFSRPASLVLVLLVMDYRSLRWGILASSRCSSPWS